MSDTEQRTKPNGSTQLLLWLNTILTAVILAGGGFVTEKLWSGQAALNATVEANARTLIRVETRQEQVLDTLPKIELRLNVLEMRTLTRP